ncbi:unnamed protein product [Coccothraustes coccothraustes]
MTRAMLLLETGGKRRRQSPRRGRAWPCPPPPRSPLSSTGPPHSTAPPVAWALPQPQGCSTSLSRHLGSPTTPSAASVPASRLHESRHDTPTSGVSAPISGSAGQRVARSALGAPGRPAALGIRGFVVHRPPSHSHRSGDRTTFPRGPGAEWWRLVALGSRERRLRLRR